MASALPPVRGVAFSFEISLVSQADTDTFQDNPTLAAGDVRIVKDGTLDGNIDTLPTAVTSLTRVLTVPLSVDEMTADRVTVLFHDAAGSEWQDAVVTIYTAAQTLDTTDGIADDIKATVNHANYGNAKLVRSTTPANTLDVSATGEAGLDWANVGNPTTAVTLTNTQINSVSGTVSANLIQMNGDTDPVDNLVLAIESGGYIRANLVRILGTALTETAGLIAAAFSKFFNKATPTGTVNSLPDAVAGAAGGVAIVGSQMDLVNAPNATAVAAIQAGLSTLGSGAITFTYTLESSVDASPIADADVWVTTDSAGSNVIAVGRTNAAGQVVFYLDAGTVYVWRQKTGWTFANPDTEVVA